MVIKGNFDNIYTCIMHSISKDLMAFYIVKKTKKQNFFFFKVCLCHILWIVLVLHVVTFQQNVSIQILLTAPLKSLHQSLHTHGSLMVPSHLNKTWPLSHELSFYKPTHTARALSLSCSLSLSLLGLFLLSCCSDPLTCKFCSTVQQERIPVLNLIRP